MTRTVHSESDSRPRMLRTNTPCQGDHAATALVAGMRLGGTASRRVASMGQRDSEVYLSRFRVKRTDGARAAVHTVTACGVPVCTGATSMEIVFYSADGIIMMVSNRFVSAAGCMHARLSIASC